MPRYLVTWDIDIFEAGDERRAAAEALRIMRDSDSTALVFRVLDLDKRGEAAVIVDLDIQAPSAVEELDSSTKKEEKLMKNPIKTSDADALVGGRALKELGEKIFLELSSQGTENSLLYASYLLAHLKIARPLSYSDAEFTVSLIHGEVVKHIVDNNPKLKTIEELFTQMHQKSSGRRGNGLSASDKEAILECVKTLNSFDRATLAAFFSNTRQQLWSFSRVLFWAGETDELRKLNSIMNPKETP